jgi:hypothetical protein
MWLLIQLRFRIYPKPYRVTAPAPLKSCGSESGFGFESALGFATLNKSFVGRLTLQKQKTMVEPHRFRMKLKTYHDVDNALSIIIKLAPKNVIP